MTPLDDVVGWVSTSFNKFFQAHVQAGDYLVECARLLLEAKANPDRKDSTGSTPLHKLMMVETSTSNVSVVSRLLRCLAAANASFDERDNDGWTPLGRLLGRLFGPPLIERRAVGIECVVQAIADAYFKSATGGEGEAKFHRHWEEACAQVAAVLDKSDATMPDRRNYFREYRCELRNLKNAALESYNLDKGAREPLRKRGAAALVELASHGAAGAAGAAGADDKRRRAATEEADAEANEEAKEEADPEHDEER